MMVNIVVCDRCTQEMKRSLYQKIVRLIAVELYIPDLCDSCKAEYKDFMKTNKTKRRR